MAKDLLARGAKSAVMYPSKNSTKGDEIVFRNKVVSDEPREEAVHTFTPTKSPKKVQVIPFYDRILVDRDEAEQASDLVYLVETNKEKPAQGTIRAVGFGRLVNGVTVPLYSQPGMKVLFGKYAGTEVNVNGQILLLMREDEVLGELSTEG